MDFSLYCAVLCYIFMESEMRALVESVNEKMERLDNEMVVTSNDYSQNGRPEYNEVIFTLPRSLISVEGIVAINGNLSPDRKSLRICFLKEEEEEVNKRKVKIFYVITFDYVGNEMILERVEKNNELTVEKRYNLSSIGAGAPFNFYMKFYNNDQGYIRLGIMSESVGSDNITLLSESELQKNIFFSINEDALKILQLDYIWKNQQQK